MIQILFNMSQNITILLDGSTSKGCFELLFKYRTKSSVYLCEQRRKAPLDPRFL